MRRRQGRMSLRDTMLQNQAADRYYASMSEKPVDLAGIFAEAAIPAAPKPRAKRAGNDPSEHSLQSAVISWWALIHSQYHLPEFSLAAIPNGGARDMITGSRLKAEGVRRGTPDLILAAPRKQYHGLWIEMKTSTGSTSQEQKEWLAYLNASGYRAEVCKSLESAIAAIEEYLA